MTDDRRIHTEKKYSNDDITVFWRPSKCIHVTTCYRELIEVFNPRKRPWVDMQGAPTEEIIRVVNLCPTEALSYKWNDEKKERARENEPEKQKPEEPRLEVPPTEIRVMRDGPLLVRGKFKIIGSGGNELQQMKMVSFCRCGHSQKMPFCDGTHRKINFKSE